MTENMMENQKKKGKSLRKKQQIIDTYLSLIQEKPWDKVSVMELCKKAEITRGTFYLYYEDIYDLMEQIETELLEDLKKCYAACRDSERTGSFLREFPDRFDCSPPEIFLAWFEYSRDHRKALLPLLDRKNGDPYFVRRLKQMIREALGKVMDRDGTAKDELRQHFTEICVELHLLSVQSWLSSEPEDYLTVEDIVNLLNTMRVGSMYLAWRNGTDHLIFG